MLALSIKQPWATLVVRGVKSIEVRPWRQAPPQRRLLIHASRNMDPRPEAWQHVDLAWHHETQRVGGIIGAVEFVRLHDYPTLTHFLLHQKRHLNEPSWFQFGLTGIELAYPEILPFRRCRGWMKYFDVAVDISVIEGPDP